MSFFRPCGSFNVADNLRPSVRKMDEWFLQLAGCQRNRQVILKHAIIDFQFQFNVRLGCSAVVEIKMTRQLNISCCWLATKILQDEDVGEGFVSCWTVNGRDEGRVHDFCADFGQTENGETSIIASVLLKWSVSFHTIKKHKSARPRRAGQAVAFLVFGKQKKSFLLKRSKKVLQLLPLPTTTVIGLKRKRNEMDWIQNNWLRPSRVYLVREDAQDWITFSRLQLRYADSHALVWCLQRFGRFQGLTWMLASGQQFGRPFTDANFDVNLLFQIVFLRREQIIMKRLEELRLLLFPSK